jgi:hypothetical protein
VSAAKHGVVALLHRTPLTELPSIFRAGALVGGAHRGALGGKANLSNGVFVEALFDKTKPVSSVGLTGTAARYVTMVFSLDPLDRNDYYAQHSWNYGVRKPWAVGPGQLVEHLEELKASTDGTGFGINELVFGESSGQVLRDGKVATISTGGAPGRFSLRDLREIWVHPSVYDETLTMMKKLRPPPGTTWERLLVRADQTPMRPTRSRLGA